MRCSISAASAVLPSLRAKAARAESSRIAVRMSLTLWVSPVLMLAPSSLIGRGLTASTRVPAFGVRPTLQSELAAALPSEELVSEPHHRVIFAVGHALLHRDQRVVGDLDVFGADLGAALGDVAQAEAEVLLSHVLAV